MTTPKIEPLSEVVRGQHFWEVCQRDKVFHIRHFVAKEKLNGCFNYFGSEPDALAWISQQLNPAPEPEQKANLEQQLINQCLKNIPHDKDGKRIGKGCFVRYMGQEIEITEDPRLSKDGNEWCFDSGIHNILCKDCEFVSPPNQPTDQDVPRDKNGKELQLGMTVTFKETGLIYSINKLYKGMHDGAWYFKNDSSEISWQCHCWELIEPKQEKGLREWVKPFLEGINYVNYPTETLLTMFAQYVESQQKGETHD